VLFVEKKFHLIDVATGKNLRQIPNDNGLESLAISADGKTLLAGVRGKSTQTRLPDGTSQYSPAENDLACLWDLSAGKLLKRVTLPEAGVGPVAFSPDGKLIAISTGTKDGRIRLLDVSEGTYVGVIKGFRGYVRCSLIFSPDGRRLISGMSDTTGLVWDLPMVLDLPIKR
jgi:WD40 repeat protein